MIKHIFTIVLLFVSLTYGYTQEIITENGRAYKLHTVQKGEGLYRLSVNNNTTQEEIIAANPKLKETGLNVGMTIRIPLKETIRENTPITEYTTHVVAKGETAYSISRLYEMTLVEFYRLNPGCESGLSLGQAVKVKTKEQKKIDGFRIHATA